MLKFGYVPNPKYEELTEELQFLSDLIGIENVIKMIDTFGGANFYIPKFSKLDKFVHRFIKENKDCSNKKLCVLLKCSEQYIRNQKKKNY